MVTKVDETATTAASRNILRHLERERSSTGLSRDKDLQDQIAAMLIL